MLWEDHSQNVVNSKDLVNLTKKKKKLRIGNKVKMYYDNKWYYGTVLDYENECDSTTSSDNKPLSNISKKFKKYTKTQSDGQTTFSRPHRKIVYNKPLYVHDQQDSQYESSDENDDLDKDPTYSVIDSCCHLNCKNSGKYYVCTVCSKSICKFHVKFISQGPICSLCHISKYNAIITPTEECNSSSDDEPLVEVTKNSKTKNTLPTPSRTSSTDTFHAQTCSAFNCSDEISFACVHCLNLLCWEHFMKESPCEDHTVLPDRFNESIDDFQNIKEQRVLNLMDHGEK